MTQPVPADDLIRMCPVCFAVGKLVAATVISINGYSCCDIHAPIVAENGLDSAITAAKKTAGVA